ncbi:MAG: AAC(3) family N-acetyltransferase [Cyclobacteriaceae bacterium]|nr:AAC(3) family N-acetyltransferase [Cyclobacteriaceae bacterium]
MHNIESLKLQMASLGIMPSDTLLIHSSMKAVGKVEGGAEAVIDAFMQYLHQGLLVFPTHTWKQIDEEYNVYDPLTEPSCVGVLTNIFRNRPGVYRSLHPTHSVAARGKGAEEFVSGEEHYGSPCPRLGCWGKLVDKKGKVLFLGCSLKTNTLIHGVEEWCNISNRHTEYSQLLKIKLPDGRLIDRAMLRHYHPSGDISQNYDKLEKPLIQKGIAKTGQIGDAHCNLCDITKMVDLTSVFLKKNPDLFIDNEPVPEEWYI